MLKLKKILEFKNILKIPLKIFNNNFVYLKKNKFSQYKEFSHSILL